jgi:hypothetical protein
VHDHVCDVSSAYHNTKPKLIVFIVTFTEVSDHADTKMLIRISQLTHTWTSLHVRIDIDQPPSVAPLAIVVA